MPAVSYTRESISLEGGTIGKLNFSLEWHDANDLDLHLVCPCGNHVFFGQKDCKFCSTYLDIDMNASSGKKDEVNPVEHIYTT